MLQNIVPTPLLVQNWTLNLPQSLQNLPVVQETDTEFKDAIREGDEHSVPQH